MEAKKKPFAKREVVVQMMQAGHEGVCARTPVQVRQKSLAEQCRWRATSGVWLI